MRRSILLGVVGMLVSCGPIKSGTLLVEAQAELSAASLAEADKHAPFEYAAAEEYIHKAREEQSYAEFERAIMFARKSRDCARIARGKAQLTVADEMGAPEERPTAAPSKLVCVPGPLRDVPIADIELQRKLKLPRDAGNRTNVVPAGADNSSQGEKPPPKAEDSSKAKDERSSP